MTATEHTLTPAGEEIHDSMVRHGRNHSPGVLVDAILIGYAPEEDIPWLTSHAWTMCEYPARAEDPLTWRALFNRIGYRNANGQPLDRPEMLTLYRGASIREHESGQFGMSWTTSREKAVWFASRYEFEADTVVYRCDVPGFALFADYRDSGRKEDEIVVNAEHVTPGMVTIEQGAAS